MSSTPSFLCEIYTNNQINNNQITPISGIGASWMCWSSCLQLYISIILGIYKVRKNVFKQRTFCKKKFFDLQHGTNKSMYIPNLDDSLPSSKKSFHTSSLGTTYQCRIQNIKKTIWNSKKKYFGSSKLN